MKRRAKALLGKVSFMLGRNPKVLKYRDVDTSRCIPEPYKAVLIISADFELAWAWRYAKASDNSKEKAITCANTARENIPRILELCERYDIPITWATVGHLFLESCDCDGNFPHPQVSRVPYHENQYWRFDRGDWYDDDPCTDWHNAREWYAPDLIRMVLDSKVKHEIACHTFSHIDCHDNICPPHIFVREIEECKKYARKYGIKLESFVHPGHTIGNLPALRKLGFRSFRTDYSNTLGYPKRHSSGLWEFSGTAELAYRKEWSVSYHSYRYAKIVERALERHNVCYYWFHPSLRPIFVERVMPAIFEFANSRRKSIWVTTMKDYASWLEGVKNENS